MTMVFSAACNDFIVMANDCAVVKDFSDGHDMYLIFKFCRLESSAGTSTSTMLQSIVDAQIAMNLLAV